MKTKYRLLSLLLALAMAFSLTGLAYAGGGEEDDQPTDMTGQLVILHTNDVHSRVEPLTETSKELGYAMVASAKAYYESLGANVLLLDDGDALHGFPFANINKGENIVDLMNLVGYDAMAPGNHDFNYGVDRLIELSGVMDFPLLCANLIDEEDDESVFDAFTVFEFDDGTTVGVFGLATPETRTKANPTFFEGYDFCDDYLAEVTQDVIDEILDLDVDYVVALGHLGIDAQSAPWRSTDIIEAISGLDVFIDGHSHTALENGLLIEDKDGNEVVLAQTGSYIYNIGIVTISDDTITAGFVDPKIITPDEEVKAKIDEINAVLAPELARVVAKTDVDLTTARNPGNRTMETNMGDLAADALAYVSGADVALTNGGGIRDTPYSTVLPAGDITYGDLNAIYPFGNIVTTIEITGEDLLAALEHGVKDLPGPAGGFPQVSGMTFDVYLPLTGNRVHNVMIGDEPLDLEATYTLATNDFTQVGGDGYDMLAKYAPTGNYGALDEALIAYVEEALDGVVGEEYAKPQGRLNILCADVLSGAWYFDYVRDAIESGLMTHTGNGSFEPDATITRAMAFMLLWNIAGNPEPEETASDYFSDTPLVWYSKAIAWAYEELEVKGYGNGVFDPNRPISRQEMATLFYLFAEYLDIVGGDLPEVEFTDADDIGDWAIDAVAYCVREGLIEGNPDGSFVPQGNLNRAGAAKLATLFADLISIDNFKYAAA